MGDKKSGGKRIGAGRPQKTAKKLTCVVRVPLDIADLVKQVSKLDGDHLLAVRRTVAHSEGISITAEKLFQERLYLLEQDAEARISELEAKLLESKQSQGGDYESKFKQLSSELYPALARLRELVPDERW